MTLFSRNISLESTTQYGVSTICLYKNIAEKSCLYMTQHYQTVNVRACSCGFNYVKHLNVRVSVLM